MDLVERRKLKRQRITGTGSSYTYKLRASRRLDPKCRMCRQSNDTIRHAYYNFMPETGTKENKRRNHKITKAIHWDLAERCEFERKERWYDHDPESVPERLTTTNFCGTSVFEQTIKFGPEDRIG